jgi:hypothetical protein
LERGNNWLTIYKSFKNIFKWLIQKMNMLVISNQLAMLLKEGWGGKI